MTAASNSLTVVCTRSLRIIFDDHRRSAAALADRDNAGHRENRIRIESYDIGRLRESLADLVEDQPDQRLWCECRRRPKERHSASMDPCARGDYRI